MVAIQAQHQRYRALIERHGLNPALGWFKVAEEKGWCKEDPFNPKVIPKGPDSDWKPEDDLSYREKLRRGILDH